MSRRFLSRPKTPHLPFELDVASLPTTNPVVALWHGSAHMFRSNATSDPMLASGVDAINGKWNKDYPFHLTQSDPPTPAPAGGTRNQPRVRWPVYPGVGAEWGRGGTRVADFRVELQWAKDAGFTALAWEPVSLIPTTTNWRTFENAFYAAEGVEGISIALCLDSATIKSLATNDLANNTGTSWANAVLPYLKHHKHMTYGGRIPIFAVSPFLLESAFPGWHEDFFSRLQHVSSPIQPTDPNLQNSILTPMFNHGGSYTSLFNGWKNDFLARNGGVGFSGSWSVSNPGQITPQGAMATHAHTNGQKFMWNVKADHVRPDDGWFDESGGLRMIKTACEYAIENMQAGDVLYWCTWNDLSEGTEVVPGMMHQWAIMDICAYYNAWFRSGVQPTIVRDCLYYMHRIQAYDAPPNTAYQTISTGQPLNRFFNKNPGTSPSVDRITVLAFLTSGGMVEILNEAGAVIASQLITDAEAAAGPQLVQTTAGNWPESGRPSFRLIRGGSTVINMPSAFSIRATIPYWQDLKYRAGGSLRYYMGLNGYSHPHIEPVELAHDWTKGMTRYG